MKVIYKKQTFDLDSSKTLGQGGEAIIIKQNNLAFKIYHEPSQYREKKLLDFLSQSFHLPQSVMTPLDVVTNPKGKIIGFAMNVAEKCQDFINLFDTDFRSIKKYSTIDVVKLFSQVLIILDKIHNEKLVVGDFNDLNLLFDKNNNPQFIDVDSYQFSTYPCIVCTDMYLDPKLYGLDLTKAPYFSKETDFYSFTVMFFRALYFVHPYAGVHKTCKSMFSRATQKIWAFDKAVIYPKIGLNPEIIDDDTLNYFSKVLSKGERLLPSQQTLKSLEVNLVECKSCGIYYSSTSPKCPQCQKITVQHTVDLSSILTKKIVGTERCESTLIFNTTGIILFTKVLSNSDLVVIYYDDIKNMTKLAFFKEGTPRYDIDLWNGLEKDIKYDFFNPDCLVFSQKSKVPELSCLFVKKIFSTINIETTTFQFSDKPVFSCSKDSLYRLTQTSIVSSSLQYNNLLDHMLTSSVAEQTWFYVGQNGLGLGFYRIFSDQKYFVFSNKGRYEIELDKLDGQLIEFDVKTSINQLILLRKNIFKGRTYSQWQIINDEGKVLESRKEESINSELLNNIYGKELVGSSIMHPTDAGVVIEKHGTLSLKSSTAEYINSNSKLSLFKQGLLTVNDKKILYLRLI